MHFLHPDAMNTHPLYHACRSQIVAALKRQDELLGPGLLRLRCTEEDLGTLVVTPRKTLRSGWGVEAALWYCENPEDGNFQSVVFQLLPILGQPELIDVVAYEGATDTETPIIVFEGTNDVAAAIFDYLPRFLARAKDAVEFRK